MIVFLCDWWMHWVAWSILVWWHCSLVHLLCTLVHKIEGFVIVVSNRQKKVRPTSFKASRYRPTGIDCDTSRWKIQRTRVLEALVGITSRQKSTNQWSGRKKGDWLRVCCLTKWWPTTDFDLFQVIKEPLTIVCVDENFVSACFDFVNWIVDKPLYCQLE